MPKAAHARSIPRPLGATFRAQFEHNEHNQSTTDPELPVDLPLVVEAWEDLPDVVRAAIAGMVKGTVKGR